MVLLAIYCAEKQSIGGTPSPLPFRHAIGAFLSQYGTYPLGILQSGFLALGRHPSFWARPPPYPFSERWGYAVLFFWICVGV
jgi:hypothetical protein